MKKSTNYFRSLALIMLSIAVLVASAAGCAGSGTDQTTSASTTQAPSTTETTTAPVASESSEATDATTESSEPANVELPDVMRVAALKGPTGMGIAKMVKESDSDNYDQNYEFSFAGSPDELTAGLISGQLDIAALPTNLASVLYHKTEKNIQLLAINTLGVLYILEAGDTVQEFKDLAGKEILATGQGAVPEYVLSKLITDSGIENTTVSYKAEHSELASLAISGDADLVMLPEPFVTTVLSKREDMRLALDLTQVWQKNQTAQGAEGDLAMGCLAVRREFAEQYPEAIETFLQEYQKSTEFANDEPEAAGELIAEYGIMADAGLAVKAIPNCYITMVSGDEMKSVLNPLLETLLAANPKSIGGALPEDDFYYVGQE
ncbi:MAG: ABC transporter substrate-binding protein [Eubacteriales bacterium]|nr:ABC transporter substrate-binding protein [Eubacteriales bacterium]MDD3197578.1 ABC transporter substrate-binding protein [Eubacteriales bacterium]MDD3503083.1 ABC transporter substrate-binding protein [Eubacteriales bacterium]MDD4683150.1 ABC transporter substrate-binding protein [Eubacteriales bacterium]